ncbi:MAG TPA: CIA30 family protein, partial [Lacunisphaera sp.]|nr:CIA30 family protein [Lacunisphaera sp.]
SCSIALTLLAACVPALHAADPAIVDDFSNPAATARGAGRLLFTDKDAGSRSQAVQRCEHGVLLVEGKLVPGRGAPAFISIPFLLSPAAEPQDLSAYTGVRLKVKLTQGILSVQVASTEVTNFDYHTAPVAGKRGEFVEVRVPFKDFKRAWSEPTALNVKAATSLNLVAFGMAPDAFAYEVDEIGFY